MHKLLHLLVYIYYITLQLQKKKLQKGTRIPKIEEMHLTVIMFHVNRTKTSISFKIESRR